MKLLVVGCGDTGLRVARQAMAAGWPVDGVVRGHDSARRLREAGVTPQVVDLDAAAPDVTGATHVLVAAPPPRSGQTDPRLARVLGALRDAAHVQRLVYISTSGVYGDAAGAWVDETRPLAPVTPRAIRRADAEAQVETWSASTGVAAVRLRVPGIYGPGRLPVTRLQRGLPVIRPEEAPWSNRIHVEDLAAVCWLALTRSEVAGVFNVADGAPTTMTDYFLRCAAALGLPPPPQIPLAMAEQALGAQAASFVRESRRLDITRAAEVLGFVPVYADLADGLAASVAAQNG